MSADGGRGSVLVVDDEPTVAELSRYLQRAGYATETASGGAGVVHAAVILLSDRSGELDRVVGLRSGADDFVVKPFSPVELVARVDAVLRGAPERAPVREKPLEFAELKIDTKGRKVAVRGSEVRLTQKEYDLLLYLAEHPGQVYSRDDLMRTVWQYSFYTDASTVTVHMRRLRAKIEADPSRPRHLLTVWGVGYRFEP